MFLFCLLFIAALVNADVSAKAAYFNLTKTWTAPMPALPITVDAARYITSNWHTSSIYASEDISFIHDPIDTNSTSVVMKVDYPAGSYAPIGTKNGNNGVKGGAEFFSRPNGKKEYNTGLLSYDVAFGSDFNWVKGGKLPGIYGGKVGPGCSGGEKATGANCFSVRMMWRAKGAGEAYAYIPTSKSLCSEKEVLCHGSYGTSFSRGVFSFSVMKWSHIEIYVKTNSGNHTNGILKVWQDDSLVIDQQNIKFRANESLGVSSLMFSTFFGGGSTSYATPVNTSSYFRNFQLSIGNTPSLNNTPNSSLNNTSVPNGTSSSIEDSAAVSLYTSSLYYYFILLVVLYQLFA
ncbi:hypothetical protein G6F37_009791 [Rhizopus arrhizus]|nr:hypothetical protein G6F38_009947 [Rhizopus arrhizus]KAG1154066.1 hypothetical protein G6F37_009791 [Rhizopus arrhizus]